MEADHKKQLQAETKRIEAEHKAQIDQEKKKSGQNTKFE
jgi:hypothetical protein